MRHKSQMQHLLAELNKMSRNERNEPITPSTSQELNRDHDKTKTLRPSSAFNTPSSPAPNIGNTGREREKEKEKEKEKEGEKEEVKESVDAVNPKQENIQIGKILDIHEERLKLLQRDKEFYDSQHKKMMQKIVSLTTQLEEAKLDATNCIFKPFFLYHFI